MPDDEFAFDPVVRVESKLKLTASGDLPEVGGGVAEKNEKVAADILREKGIEVSGIVTAFAEQTVGTKVTDVASFAALLHEAIAGYDFAGQKVPGQGYVRLADRATETVSAGVGLRTENPDDYHPVLYRGSVGLYLNREKAATADSVAAIVYTREAYLNDPDVLADPKEHARIAASDAKHVLVAVLASAGPESTVDYERFVKNLAGGNRSYAPEHTTHSGLVELAKQVVTYRDAWATVAD